MKKVKAASYNPADYTNFLETKPANITNYIRGKKWDMTFIPGLLNFIDESPAIKVSMGDAVAAMKQIEKEKLLTKEQISKRLPNKQNYVRLAFGALFVDMA